MTGARETALQALMACRKEGAWANAVLKEYIARNRLDARDAALASRLCYGVVQNRLRLDYFLEGLLSRPLAQLHPVVRDVLHLGLYQLYDLDKIPASAAVNESVALAKKYVSNPKAPALVNGVLRSAQREGKRPEPTSYALRYSHPEELTQLLKGSLPKGTLEPMLKADNEAPRTVVQANTLKTTPAELKRRLEAEGAEALRHCHLPGAGRKERACRRGEIPGQPPHRPGAAGLRRGTLRRAGARPLSGAQDQLQLPLSAHPPLRHDEEAALPACLAAGKTGRRQGIPERVRVCGRERI